MLRFVLRRLLVAVPLLLASSIVTFVLATNMGMPQKLEDLQTKPGASPQTIQALRQQYDLDVPVVKDRKSTRLNSSHT